ncbi:MAG: DUF134 domain-containing protein [Oscillospiraceae bacterium]
MPRPQKERYVCCMPQNNCFSPSKCVIEDSVFMTIDEYETIRLIDLENYTQQDCADQMHIARTTVQGIYNVARKKIADAIVNAKRLEISGGDYRLCEKYASQCGRGCKKHCHNHKCKKEI